MRCLEHRLCEIKVKNTSDLVWDINRQHETKTNRKYPVILLGPCCFPRLKRALLPGWGGWRGCCPLLPTVKATALLQQSSTNTLPHLRSQMPWSYPLMLRPWNFSPCLKTWQHCYPIFHRNNSIFKIWQITLEGIMDQPCPPSSAWHHFFFLRL